MDSPQSRRHYFRPGTRQPATNVSRSKSPHPRPQGIDTTLRRGGLPEYERVFGKSPISVAFYTNREDATLLAAARALPRSARIKSSGAPTTKSPTTALSSASPSPSRRREPQRTQPEKSLPPLNSPGTRQWQQRIPLSSGPFVATPHSSTACAPCGPIQIPRVSRLSNVFRARYASMPSG